MRTVAKADAVASAKRCDASHGDVAGLALARGGFESVLLAALGRESPCPADAAAPILAAERGTRGPGAALIKDAEENATVLLLRRKPGCIMTLALRACG